MLQQTNGKLRTYITFKSNFGREKYLSVLKKTFWAEEMPYRATYFLSSIENWDW